MPRLTRVAKTKAIEKMKANKKKPAKKGRAIVEVDTDGSYVMCTSSVEESEKVKMFDKFIGDLKKLVTK